MSILRTEIKVSYSFFKEKKRLVLEIVPLDFPVLSGSLTIMRNFNLGVNVVDGLVVIGLPAERCSTTKTLYQQSYFKVGECHGRYQPPTRGATTGPRVLH